VFSMIVEAGQVLLSRKIRRNELFQQIYFIANGSLGIVICCVAFAAMVTILESSFHMKIVLQNDSLVPGFAAVLILRELAAVVTALLLTARVGAGIAAEVGSMKISEQIDALQLLGIDPIEFIVVPRLIAGAFTGLVLTLIANAVCLFFASLVSQIYLGFTGGSFLAAMNRFASIQDLWFSLIKGVCFGCIIPIVSCYYGFTCKPGADGVGNATTKSVVVASTAIIITDFLLSYVFSHFY
jgi:phospholipid/cholesterol/gamma-HCH transport system permease protein